MLTTLAKKVRKVIRWLRKTSRRVLKWISKGWLTRILLYVVFALEMYRVFHPQWNLTERAWLLFSTLKRLFYWLFEGAVVQSILGALALLICYSAAYWLLIRKRRFIVVSEFRVWGDLAKEFPEKGMAARLRDELMRLWEEMRTQSLKTQPTHIATGAVQDVGPNSLEVRQVQLDDGGLSLPETHVTLQYEGISLEAMHTFVRRITGREVVVTGDLISHQNGLVLVARTTNDGPWEVQVEKSDSTMLAHGLRGLAIRIMASMTRKFQPEAVKAFALLQMKAKERGEYDQALHLAQLGWQAAREDVDNKDKARRNLATAYNDMGVEMAQKEEFKDALLKFGEAIVWDPGFEEAFNNLKRAADKVERRVADEALRKANDIRFRHSRLHA